MAITDIQVVGDTPYCKIGDNAYLWKIKQALKLTDSHYKMYEVYPDAYDSMTAVPDALDTSELTTMSDMFVKFVSPDFPEDSSPTQEEYEEEVAKTRAIANVTIAPEMDCSNVTDMSNMFGVYVLEEFKIDPDDKYSDVRSIYTSYGCSNLTTVPEYDTSKVKNFSCMFAGCTSLPKVFPWTIDAYGDDFNSFSNFGSGFNNMFSGSSVEEVTFSINTPSYAKAWFGDKDPLDFFMILDQENGLKKVTILSGVPDDKVVIDNDGVHYYGLSADN
jgi:hypothetical protein